MQKATQTAYANASLHRDFRLLIWHSKREKYEKFRNTHGQKKSSLDLSRRLKHATKFFGVWEKRAFHFWFACLAHTFSHIVRWRCQKSVPKLRRKNTKINATHNSIHTRARQAVEWRSRVYANFLSLAYTIISHERIKFHVRIIRQFETIW